MDSKQDIIFKYFDEICKIPHGSGNMKQISNFCLEFAKKNNLKAIRDKANNVIIYKDGTIGYENSDPIILQGHIDMVCQKTEDSNVDFENDGIETYIDGDFLKAKGTTLGADNGIAVAMIFTILASNDISHPPIEAIFTTDEEIGMLGAEQLDTSLLKSKRMINLDSEESNILTVSCAGGSDFKQFLPYKSTIIKGSKVVLEVKKLTGGHSGVEIDKGRVNANILMGRILNQIANKSNFDIISITGGDKSNAIPRSCKAELVATNSDIFIKAATDVISSIKSELSQREKNLEIVFNVQENGNFDVLDFESKNKLLFMLLTTPNGIIDMSVEIEGLVETSLNLGILSTDNESITMQYALRSNKLSALVFLEEKMQLFAKNFGLRSVVSGRYLPWEFKENSHLQQLYIKVYENFFQEKPIVAAIHAGLECAVFSNKIPDLDCISIGPDMQGVHTVEEKLNIPSTVAVFEVLCDLLENSK